MNEKVNMKKRIADVLYLVGSIAGAGLISLNAGYNQMGYAMFLVASIAGIYLLKYHAKDVSWSLFVVNIYFAVVNVNGFFQYAN